MPLQTHLLAIAAALFFAAIIIGLGYRRARRLSSAPCDLPDFLPPRSETLSERYNHGWMP